LVKETDFYTRASALGAQTRRKATDIAANQTARITQIEAFTNMQEGISEMPLDEVGGIKA